jgi:hypothetical protein
MGHATAACAGVNGMLPVEHWVSLDRRIELFDQVRGRNQLNPTDLNAGLSDRASQLHTAFLGQCPHRSAS